MIAYEGSKNIYNDSQVDELIKLLGKEEERDFIEEFKNQIVVDLAYIYNDTAKFIEFMRRVSVYVEQLYEE